LVAASNVRLLPFSGFPNYPRPQLPDSYFSQLQLSLSQSPESRVQSPESRVRVRVRFTLRLVVYLQPVRLGALRLTARDFCFLTDPLRGQIPYITSSITRGWVCRLQLVLVLASAVILGSDTVSDSSARTAQETSLPLLRALL
jgi:hypothetical protein